MLDFAVRHFRMLDFAVRDFRMLDFEYTNEVGIPTNEVQMKYR